MLVALARNFRNLVGAVASPFYARPAACLEPIPTTMFWLNQPHDETPGAAERPGGDEYSLRRRRRPRAAAGSLSQRPRGVVLVMVLVVLMVLVLAAYTFSELMVVERQAVDAAGTQIQARALAESGGEYVRAFLQQSQEIVDGLGGIYDNPQEFQGVEVVPASSPGGAGRFSVVSRMFDGDGYPSGIRFGLEDESTKININALATMEQQAPESGLNLLLGLPGMTEDLAYAIIDFVDADDVPGGDGLGAESEYYGSLSPPQVAPNGPIDNLDQLRLVRGMIPELLSGLDADESFLVDEQEQTGLLAEYVDNSTGEMDWGWSSFLTIYSRESTLAPDGNPKIDLNQTDMQTLYDQLEPVLGADWAGFIVAYRQNGPVNDDQSQDEQGSGDGQNDSTGQNNDDGATEEEPEAEAVNGRVPDLALTGNTEINSLIDLIGSKTRVQFQGEDEQVTVTSPSGSDPLTLASQLPLLLDYTMVKGDVRGGRININQAPPAVLRGLPGMTEELLSGILSSRSLLGGETDLRHPTWLLTTGLVTIDQMKQLYPYVTGGGSVFRAQVYGIVEGRQSTSRAEFVWDSSDGTGRILFWKDLTPLGGGLPVDLLGAGLSGSGTTP